MGRHLTCLLAGMLGAAGACTDSEGAGPAAPRGAAAAPGGGDDATLPGPPEGFSVTPPAEPAAPQLPAPPCPAGWLAAGELPEGTSDDGPCVPPPRVACEGAYAQLTGDAECRRIGTPCPEGGGFLDEAGIRALVPGFDGNIRYVDPRARRGGDGTRERPFRSVREALRRPAGAGGVVALAVGAHGIQPFTLRDLALVGSCAEGTTVSTPVGDATTPALRLEGGQAAVANLSLGGGGPGIEVRGGQGRLHGVVLQGLASFGVRVAGEGARGELTDVVVRDVATIGQGINGVGVIAVSGAVLEAERLLVERCTRLGVGVSPGEPAIPVTARLSDVVLREVRFSETDGASSALLLTSARAEVERLLIEQVEDAGVTVYQSSPNAPPPTTLSDVVIRDVTFPDPTVPVVGVSIRGGGVSLTRAGFARLSGIALELEGQPDGEGEIELTDVWVRDVTRAAVDNPPPAIGIHGGARVRGSRLRVERILGEGLGVSAAAAHLTDVVMRDLGSASLGELPAPGIAVRIYDGGELSLERVLLEDLVEAGIKVLGVGEEHGRPRLTLTDATVRGVRPALDMKGSLGIQVAWGADAALSRVRIEDVVGGGFLAFGDEEEPAPVIEVEDLSIADITADLDGLVSVGLGLLDGARLTGERIRIERATVHGVSLSVVEMDRQIPTLDVSDLRVAETAPVPTWLDLGVGIRVAWAGSATIRRAVVEANHLAGVRAEGDPEDPKTSLRLEQVVIRDTRAAPCADLPESDLHACRGAGRGQGGGSGLTCRGGATVSLEEFEVTGSELAGLLVARGGRLEGRRGRVHGNEIGVNVTDPDWDPDLLSDAVFVYDNSTDYAADQLHVPEPDRLLAELVE